MYYNLFSVIYNLVITMSLHLNLIVYIGKSNDIIIANVIKTLITPPFPVPSPDERGEGDTQTAT